MNNFLNIKFPFIVPTKDLKEFETIMLNVKTNIPKEGGLMNEDPIYKVTIPDFIFNELADSEPIFFYKI